MADVYSRGDYSALPADDATLEHIYTAGELIDISSDDDVYVGQSAVDEYPIHQAKIYVGSKGVVRTTWQGRSTHWCAERPVFLEVYNQTAGTWEILSCNNHTLADVDFELGAELTDLADYKDGSDYVSFRIYQKTRLLFTTLAGWPYPIPYMPGLSWNPHDPMDIPLGIGTHYIVDGAAPGGGDGSEEHPFNTIQAGVDALDGPGDTVRVKGGLYRETVYFGKSGDPDDPFILCCYDDENEVIIDNSPPVSGWTLYQSSPDIWRVYVGELKTCSNLVINYLPYYKEWSLADLQAEPYNWPWADLSPTLASPLPPSERRWYYGADIVRFVDGPVAGGFYLNETVVQDNSGATGKVYRVQAYYGGTTRREQLELTDTTGSWNDYDIVRGQTSGAYGTPDYYMAGDRYAYVRTDLGDPDNQDVGLVQFFEGGGQACVGIPLCDNIKIYGITARFAKGNGITTYVSTNVHIERCKGLFCSNTSVYLPASTNCSTKRCFSSMSYFVNWQEARYPGGGWGSAFGGGGSTNCIVEGCLAYLSCGEGVNFNASGSGNIVRKNVMYHVNHAGIYIDGEINPTVELNYVVAKKPEADELYRFWPHLQFSYAWSRLRAFGLSTGDEPPGGILNNLRQQYNIVINALRGFDYYGKGQENPEDIGYLKNVQILDNVYFMPTDLAINAVYDERGYYGGIYCLSLNYDYRNYNIMVKRNTIVYNGDTFDPATPMITRGCYSTPFGSEENYFKGIDISENRFFAKSTDKAFAWGDPITAIVRTYTYEEWYDLYDPYTPHHGTGDILYET